MTIDKRGNKHGEDDGRFAGRAYTHDDTVKLSEPTDRPGANLRALASATFDRWIADPDALAAALEKAEPDESDHIEWEKGRTDKGWHRQYADKLITLAASEKDIRIVLHAAADEQHDAEGRTHAHAALEQEAEKPRRARPPMSDDPEWAAALAGYQPAPDAAPLAGNDDNAPWPDISDPDGREPGDVLRRHHSTSYYRVLGRRPGRNSVVSYLAEHIDDHGDPTAPSEWMDSAEFEKN